jgi:hypothetical protein
MRQRRAPVVSVTLMPVASMNVEELVVRSPAVRVAEPTTGAARPSVAHVAHVEAPSDWYRSWWVVQE